MIFVCNKCGQPMKYKEQGSPEQGSVNITFEGPCEEKCAFTMVTNPAETQMIGALGVKIGGKPLPQEIRPGVPLERVDKEDDAGHTSANSLMAEGGITWSEAAQERMGRVPIFIRGMVKISYEKYARDLGLSLITPETMDEAREALGMQGM